MGFSSRRAEGTALLHLDANPKLLPEARNPQPAPFPKAAGPQPGAWPLGPEARSPPSSYALRQCSANATSTSKASLTTLAPYEYFILENMPLGTQLVETPAVPGVWASVASNIAAIHLRARFTPGHTPGSPGSTQSVGN